MKIFLVIVIVCSSLTGFSQVYGRIYDGVDSFRNDFWNNWKPKGTGKDTSAYFFDLFGNRAIRAVFNTALSGIFDNGAGYAKGQTLLPDTALRKGAYESGFSSFSFIGLTDSLKYNIRLFASRQPNSGTLNQTTSFSSQKDTVLVLTDTNTIRVAVFNNLVSAKGAITFSWYNFGKSAYCYLNAFIIEPVSKNHPLASLVIDSATITSPNSVIHLNALGSTETGGSIQAYQFLQSAGPSKAIFTADTVGRMVVSGLFPGTYRFGVIVNDGLLNTDSAFVSVSVKPVFIPPCPVCPVCPPPIVCPLPRTLVGGTMKVINGQLVYTPIYSDGQP